MNIDFDLIRTKKSFRKEAGRQCLLSFMSIYFSEYIQYSFADFHIELESDLWDDEVKRILAVMFRESAKTVFCALVYPLWCICYKKRNFIIFGSDEENAAIALMENIINELQTNKLLINDFGMLFFEQKSVYSASKKKTIKDFVTTNDIRVLARGTGQKVRGRIHKRFRPDLFIGDDIESIKSVQNKEQRDKNDKWLHSEVIPALNKVYGKIIILGNMLHKDAVVARLEAKPEVWSIHKVPVMYPDGSFAWPDRWVNTKEEAKKVNHGIDRDNHVVSIEEVKQEVGTIIFKQEWMLIPLNEADQIILDEWIKYYKQSFNHTDERRYKVVMAIDPAVSEKEAADFTAISVWVYDKLEERAYCCDYLNERLSYHMIKEKTSRLYKYWRPHTVIVEDVAAQNWLIQDLRDEYQMHVIARRRKADKRSRLVSVSHLFERGKIHFRWNQQIIVDQLINFGASEYDDLVDTVIDNLQAMFKRRKSRLVKSPHANQLL